MAFTAAGLGIEKEVSMIRLAIILAILAAYVGAIKLSLHGAETLNSFLPG
jgi:hypothetical protein